MSSNRNAVVRNGFLAVASLMLAGGVVLAGHGGGGHGGGGHGGGGHGGGIHYGGGHYAGIGQYGGIGHHGGLGFSSPGYYYYGNGLNRGFYGLGAYGLGYGGFGRGYGLGYGYGLYGLGLGSGLGYGLGYGRYGPGYGGYGLGYGAGSPYGTYGYGAAPYAYGGAMLYGSPSTTTYSNYGPPALQQPQADDNTAHVMVIVPQNAQLWFNGTQTAQTGSQREFVTPALTPGKNFTYEIRARWMENGKPVEQTRSLHVQSNAWQVVDFTKPQMPAVPQD